MKAVGLLAVLAAGGALAQGNMAANFANPPSSAKPHTWWHWINGNISKQGITADLEAMKAIGLGGAQIFNVDVGIPDGDTPYMTPQWKDALAHAFKEAKRLGIEICVHNCAGWSSSGGPWVKPKDAMQSVTASVQHVSGTGRRKFHLAPGPANLNTYQDIAVLAFPTPKDRDFRVPNLRQKAAYERGDKIDMSVEAYPKGAATPENAVKVLRVDAQGDVEVNLSNGPVTLVRMGFTPTGAVCAPAPLAGRGLEVDKLSAAALDRFWGGSMAAALAANGPVGNAGLNNALVDSYEVGSQNWTANMASEFKKRRGYDLSRHLPCLAGFVVGSPNETERFLWDYRKTVCELFTDNYIRRFKELCHKNGLKFSVEGYGNGPIDNLRVSGLADIPMGEFWVGDWTTETTKLAASAAHTNGRQVIGAESFTADDVRGRWQVDPYSVKILGDKVFCLGVNRYIFHRYAHQPWTGVEPGMTMGPWGMNLERTVTWWDEGSEWMKFIARCQFVLQQGRFVADIAAFCGDDAPNDNYFSDCPKGFDYDAVDASVLMQAKVENGEIVIPSGMRYKVLAMPAAGRVTWKTLKKISLLVADGATVWGPEPQGSPSLEDLPRNQSYRNLAKQLWSGRKYGKGQVFGSGEISQALGSADMVSATKLNWIHRKADNLDIYYVANPKKRPIFIEPKFRAGQATDSIELWDPMTGTTTPTPFASVVPGGVSVQLSLAPAGSIFVVFRHDGRGGTKHRVQPAVDPTEPPKPKIEVISARYEAVDGSGGVDVTAKVQEIVDSGESEVAATNSNFGDPTYNHVKQLVVTYSVGRKPTKLTIPENGTWQIGPAENDMELPAIEVRGNQILPWKATTVVVDGKAVPCEPARATAIDTPWRLTFQPGRGGPALLDTKTLFNWPDSSDSRVKYFSGTVGYATSFLAPAGRGRAYLDLGKVKNFATVTLNGKPFPVLWKPPFLVDVTDVVRAGENTLKVDVTNLWPNRLIGDAVEGQPTDWKSGPIKQWPDWVKKGSPRPEDGRVGFATWKFFGADSPLQESGLIGPVRLMWINPVRVD